MIENTSIRALSIVVVAASLSIFATTTVACSSSSHRGKPSAPSGSDGGNVDGGAPPPPSPSDAGLDGDGGTGDGGPPDGGRPPLAGASCDDANPCTRDRVHGPDDCRHEPVVDETVCQDGDYCTLGDRCRGGRCVPGRVVTGPMAKLGIVNGAGSFHGAVLAVDDDRFVFVDSPSFGSTLTLFGVDPSGLSLLHRRREPLLVFSVRDQLPRAALGEGRFAYVEDRYLERDVVVARADDETDQLSVLGRLDLSGLGAIDGMDGHGSHLWACVNDPFGTAGILSVSLSDPGRPAISRLIDLGERRCGSMAYVASGDVVYVNTTSGVRWLDAATAAPTVGAAFHGRGAPVASGADLLVVSDDGITAYDGSTRARRGERSGRFEGAAAGPRPDTFWAIGHRRTGAAWERYLGLFEIDPSDVSIRLVDERTLARFSFDGDTPVEPLPSDGKTVIDPSTKRVFNMTGDGIDELRHPLVGSFLQVAGEGSLVAVRSVHSAHLLDVSKPGDPRVVAGGAHGALPAYALEERSYGPWLLSPAARLFPVEDLSPVEVPSVYRDAVPVVRRRFDDALRASDEASSSIAGGPARLLVADGRLYRLAPTGSGLAARLERYRLPDPGAPFLFEMTGSWPLAVDPDLAVAPNPVVLALAVDPRSRRAVATVYGRAASGDDSAGALFWVDLDGGEDDVERFTVDRAIWRVLVSGTRAVYVPRRGVVRFVTETDPALAEVAVDRLRDVVAFDGNVVYAGLQRSYDGSVSSGLLAIPWVARSESATRWIPLSSSPSTVSAADEALVVGSYDALTTVHPECSGR